MRHASSKDIYCQMTRMISDLQHKSDLNTYSQNNSSNWHWHFTGTVKYTNLKGVMGGLRGTPLALAQQKQTKATEVNLTLLYVHSGRERLSKDRRI